MHLAIPVRVNSGGADVKCVQRRAVRGERADAAVAEQPAVGHVKCADRAHVRRELRHCRVRQ